MEDNLKNCYIHIDRAGQLTKGQFIELTKYKIPPAMSCFYNELSHHGQFYCLNRFIPESFDNIDQQSYLFSALWEIVLEYVRASYFTHIPSRFQCLFAVEPNNLDLWKNEFTLLNQPNLHSQAALIYSETAYKFDAAWLSFKNLDLQNSDVNNLSFGAFVHQAVNYWSGRVTSEPKHEILIPLPCQCIDIIPLQLIDARNLLIPNK